MAEGRSFGRRRMVGDDGGYATRGSDFTAARQHVPALCFRSVGRGLAEENRAGRCYYRPLRRRSCGRISAPADAERFLRDFQERLAKFGLEIHPEKTRLIEFGRFAASDRQKRGEGKPETFTFLGFTHFCGRNSRGHFVVWRRTAAKRLRAKLLAIKQELRRKMHEPIVLVGAWLKRVVEGYYRYHAVPGNLAVLSRFRERICRYWRRILRPRSQRRKPNWEQLRPIFNRWIPLSRTLHPYPDVRFDARIQGKSRMR